MSNIIPYQFEGANVRALEIDGEPWFVGKDVAAILGYANETDALNTHCRGVAKRYPIPDALGRSQETRLISEPDMLRLVVNSTLPAAERFEGWVFEQVLPSIRKTGTYTAKSAITPLKATAEAAKALPHLVRAARLFGCDKNAAAISANQAIYSMTNINLMQQLGHTHLEAEKQEHWYTPTELGKQMTPPVSARQVNLLLAEAGLQFKRGEVWEASEAGNDFARIYDTGKRHGSGVPVTQMKWSHTVVAVLQALPAEQKEVA